MKATGIVRRIDDLGRVVIPKEIRRREGDPALMKLEEMKVLRWMRAMMEAGKRCEMDKKY